MASRLALPLALTAALLAACKTQVQPTGLKGVTPIEGDQVTVTERHEGTAAEASYDWNYPNYPENYNVEPLRRDYASGRSLAELGSLAGPWLEGAEAKELPVGQPNVRRGAAVVRQLGGAVTAELQPKLSETPFQAFLRIREGLSSARLNNVPLSRDQLWDITFHLYTRAQPDFGVPVPVKMDPDSANDASKRKTGGQIFGSNCAMCHGADGWGRGHSGYALQPPPANFHEPRRLYNRSDEQLYTVLRDGIYGTAMPPWRDKLSEAEIRSVVAFIRSYSYSVEDETAQGGGSPAPQVRGANEGADGPDSVQGGASGGDAPTGEGGDAPTGEGGDAPAGGEDGGTPGDDTGGNER